MVICAVFLMLLHRYHVSGPKRITSAQPWQTRFDRVLNIFSLSHFQPLFLGVGKATFSA
jgi:hypothetical protein